MNPDLVFPRRKRCAACRKYFGFIVLKGLYCSYACAGVPEPDDSKWNPHCFRRIDFRRGRPGGPPERKRAFFSRWEAEASEAWASDPLLDVYECPVCLMFHLGHDWKKINEQRRAGIRRKREGRGKVVIGVDAAECS